jgi:hypothetical protein
MPMVFRSVHSDIHAMILVLKTSAAMLMGPQLHLYCTSIRTKFYGAVTAFFAAKLDFFTDPASFSGGGGV